MRPFHVVVRKFPRSPIDTRRISLDGVEVDALMVPPELQATPLDTSFEEATETLETFSRMHIEPDGSFVWVSSFEEQAAWQIEGNLYDRADRLIAIDLKGACPPSRLTGLLDVFRGDDQQLMIELVRDAVFVLERDFLELLS